ncbi:ABC transporter substrate-binding protein [Streptomyces adustus]|uniref:ABC transporter substrate-binding protein n=1 Tax=Streptomyces adustus TaxID=1609272 RepID=A0A5N8V547_9ACTN|nr:ABC transporter substrate-binding protein [Streptomyces adustus]
MIKHSRWTTLPILMGLTSALLTGCGFGIGSDGGAGIVIGMSDEVMATDPASGYDPGSWLLFNNVFQSLLSFPKGGAPDPEPDAAEKCSFSDSRSQVYRCTLKDGLHFSNGDSLTAQDVKFSFDRLRRIDDPAGPAVMFQGLDRVEVPDDRTVVFHLDTPDATFPSKIASGAGSIVDRHEYPPNAIRQDHAVIGSGPYTLDSFDKKRATFSVNDSYKGNAQVRNSGVTLEFFHGQRDTLKEALTAGDVDIAYRGLSAQDIASLEKRGGSGDINVAEGNSAEVQDLVFNMDDPVVGRLGVRRAIAYLIDRNALVDRVYKGTALPLYSIVPAGITGHNTAFFDRYGANPSRSKAAEALRADGITGKVKLTLWSTPTRYGSATDDEVKAIADQLNASGLFDAQMKSVSYGQYEKGIAAGQYGVYVKGWLPDYPDPDNFTAPFFGPENVLGNNFNNATITQQLMPRTALMSDRSRTASDFGAIQEIVADRLPMLPIWQAKQYAVVRTGVEGYAYCLDASTVFRFWELYKP